MPAGLPMKAETLRKYRTWFVVYGAVLILLGAAAIVAPGIATFAIEVAIGWLLVASGIFGLIAIIRTGVSAPGFWWSLLTAVLYLLAGLALLWDPVIGALTLTFILVAYLLATGAIKVGVALGYKQAIPRAWGWMLLSAVIDIALGVMIIFGWPGTGLWVLGLLVGINLLFTGIALIVAAMNCPRPETS